MSAIKCARATSLECLKVDKITPLEHQKRICRFIMNKHNKGILVFHSVGTGKTLTSVLASKCLSDKYPTKQILIITPTSLIGNYKKEILKSGIEFGDKLNIYSYVTFLNKLKKGEMECRNTILIIDEAHNFASKVSGKRTIDMLKCTQKAFKVVLLSATPIRNYPEEIADLISMISSEPNEDTKSKILESIRSGSVTKFNKAFDCKVSVYKNKNSDDFPTVSEYNILLKMSKEYYDDYYKIQENMKKNLPEIFKDAKDLTYFLNGVRRAVNTTNSVSPKVEWIVKKISDEVKSDRKVLLYSNWKSAGINIIKKYLKSVDITFTEITGDLTKEKRNENVKKYNSGKVKVMLVTSSGGEGLDLKETRTVIVMEPHWNQAKIVQVVGRAARYGSHSSLDKKDRTVDVFYLLLEKPKTLFTSTVDKLPSADIILDEMSRKKHKEILKFYKKLEQVSIENNPRCFD